jgi:hypothetical protein
MGKHPLNTYAPGVRWIERIWGLRDELRDASERSFVPRRWKRKLPKATADAGRSLRAGAANGSRSGTSLGPTPPLLSAPEPRCSRRLAHRPGLWVTCAAVMPLTIGREWERERRTERETFAWITNERERGRGNKKGRREVKKGKKNGKRKKKRIISDLHYIDNCIN